MAEDLIAKASVPKRLQYRPILITLAAALVLSGGSFYGCAKAFRFNQSDSFWVNFFLISFFVCVAVFAGALVWLVVAFVVHLIRKSRENP